MRGEEHSNKPKATDKKPHEELTEKSDLFKTDDIGRMPGDSQEFTDEHLGIDSSLESVDQIPTHGVLLPYQIIEMVKKGQTIPKELLEAQQRLQEFTLSFIKSLLRTSYYDGQHPESVQAKHGLYEEFKNLMEGKRELSFLVRKGWEEQDVMLDGYLDEPTTLAQIMSKNMAEIFVPKFMEYFHRKALRSFAIRTDIVREEFEKFIDIMSEMTVSEKRTTLDEERMMMIRALSDNRIFSVTVVFEEDIIGKKRRLPWRVELAISRLCKDLRTLPMYKEASDEKLRDIKMQIFADIFRPIRRPDVLAETLLNSDLIDENIENVPEVSDLDVEKEIIDILPHIIILATSKTLIRLYRDLYIHPRPMFGFDVEEVRGKTKKLMIKFAAHILEHKEPEGDDLLEIFYKEGVITFHELPDYLQDKINVSQTTDKIIGIIDDILTHIKSITTAKEYSAVVTPYGKILAELLRRAEFEILHKVCLVIFEHQYDEHPPFPERNEIAGSVLDEVWNERSLSLLLQYLTNASKEERAMLTELFLMRGELALPYLFEVLKTSEDKWARKNIINAILHLEDSAQEFLLNKLQEPGQPWYVYRNLIYLLAEFKEKRALPLMEPFLNHESYQVQIEALDYLSKTDENQCKDQCLKALRSINIFVRKRAVDLLSTMKVNQVSFTGPLVQWISEETTEDNEALQISVCRALGRLGNITMPNHQTAEAVLHQALLKESQYKLFSMWKGLNTKKSVKVQTAIAETLGKIGTKKSRRILSLLMRTKNQTIIDASKEALQKLETRLAS